MPSPFPGMDPYIEASGMWADFHATMLGAMRADLNANLPEGYAASIELYVWASSAESRGAVPIMEPDVHVRKQERESAGRTATAVMTAPTKTILPRRVRKRRRYLKVVDVRARQVVTVVELLSPSNKTTGEDRDRYLEKRNEYLANNLNFVEIDLLRGGRRPPLGKRNPEVNDFFVMVCRAWEFPEAGLWTFGMRDTLPDVPVPVTQEIGDTALHLGRCFARAFDEGRYDNSLPYDEPLKPRPREADRDWVRATLRNRPH